MRNTYNKLKLSTQNFIASHTWLARTVLIISVLLSLLAIMTCFAVFIVSFFANGFVNDKTTEVEYIVDSRTDAIQERISSVSASLDTLDANTNIDDAIIPALDTAVDRTESLESSLQLINISNVFTKPVEKVKDLNDSLWELRMVIDNNPAPLRDKLSQIDTELTFILDSTATAGRFVRLITLYAAIIGSILAFILLRGQLVYLQLRIQSFNKQSTTEKKLQD